MDNSSIVLVACSRLNIWRCYKFSPSVLPLNGNLYYSYKRMSLVGYVLTVFPVLRSTVQYMALVTFIRLLVPLKFSPQ